jgi:hypothetical protein
MPGRVGQFVKEGAVVFLRSFIPEQVGDSNTVKPRRVASPGASYFNRWTVRHGELNCLGGFNGVMLLPGCFIRCRNSYALALLHVEYGVVAEHGQAFLAIFGLWVFLLVNLPEDDRRAFLALADTSPKLLSLEEGQPVGRAESGASQEEAINALVVPPGSQV